MRIAINTFALSSRLGMAGSGRYILGLVQGLSGIDHGHEIFLFCNNDNAYLFPDDQMEKHVGNRLTEIRPTRLLWEHAMLPIQASRARIDVLHSPVFVSPLLLPSASVVTIFDITWFSHPERHTTAKRLYFTRLIPHSAGRAQRIITISESSKRDIVTTLGVPSEKVVVTYPGTDPGKFAPRVDVTEENVLKKYGIEEPYILYLGKIEPIKNLPTLIAAFRLVREDFPSYRLVIAGNKGWYFDDILSLVEHEKGIILAGYIAEGDLALVYQSADLFVYPSFYEGFGIPLLEAMACGVPLICSNVSSMPEVVGDAGILVDPRNVREIAQAVLALLRDGSLRREMRARGIVRARQFTWERMAQQTLSVYEDAYREWRQGSM